MRIIILVGIVYYSLISAWTLQKPSKLKEVEWLIGTWENKTRREIGVDDRWFESFFKYTQKAPKNLILS
ncbi:MAG: hypothetical protein AAF600_08865 [Bacteroidota bacterium]